MINASNIFFATRAEWREWLVKNHLSEKNVWLNYTKKSAGGQLTYDDIVEEALCFGWIDSLPGKVDDKTTKLYISVRKPNSVWSALNKTRLPKLVETGQMFPAGLKAIEIAKQNGSWTTLDSLDDKNPPADLMAELNKNKAAYDKFMGLAPGVKRNLIQSILMAKTAETRQKRIMLIAGN